MSGLAFRLGRALAPVPRTLVPKVLFAHVVAEVAARCASPAEVNRELHRLGIGAGDIVAVTQATLTLLNRAWPPDGDPRRVAEFSKLVFPDAWLALGDREPEARVEVAEGGLVWVELGEGPGGDALYKIATPEGVNPLYFAAGVLEGCAQVILGAVGSGWFSFWRPLGQAGVCGFLSSSARPAEEVARAVGARAPNFFRDVSWEDSAKALDEVLGARVPQAPKRAT